MRAIVTPRRFIGCVLLKGPVQSIPNITEELVTFDTGDTEEIDTHAFHNPASNPGRITVPTGLSGKYTLHGHLFFNTHASVTRRAALIYHKNSGGTVLHTQEVFYPNIDYAGISAQLTCAAVATDYFELRAYQASGGALDLIVDQTRFSVEWIGS